VKGPVATVLLTQVRLVIRSALSFWK